MKSDRRRFLQWLGAAAALPRLASAHPAAKRQPAGPVARTLAGEGRQADDSARFTAPIGLQLFSVRQQLPDHLEATLHQLAAWGYQQVEAAGYDGHSVKEFAAAIRRAGLRCPSAHYDASVLDANMAQVIDDAHLLGLDYVICSSFQWQQRFSLTPDDFKRQAANFNRWAEKLKAAGFGFGYHNHDFDFRVVNGAPLFNLLLDGTQPGLVDYEMDVFWVKRGGQDPIDYLRRYPGRFKLTHIKDMKAGTPTTLVTTATADDASVTLGTGMLDLPAILRAARQAGIHYYFIEDESPQAMGHLAADVVYLRHVRL